MACQSCRRSVQSFHHEFTQPIRIVCFGDSLTAGFQSPPENNPQRRRYALWRIATRKSDQSGRFPLAGSAGNSPAKWPCDSEKDVLAHEPRFVVILGGTNDLGWNGPTHEIMRNLVKLYEQTLAAGGVPVPVTQLPSLRVEDAGNSRGRDGVGGRSFGAAV